MMVPCSVNACAGDGQDLSLDRWLKFSATSALSSALSRKQKMEIRKTADLLLYEFPVDTSTAQKRPPPLLGGDMKLLENLLK